LQRLELDPAGGTYSQHPEITAPNSAQQTKHSNNSV